MMLHQSILTALICVAGAAAAAEIPTLDLEQFGAGESSVKGQSYYVSNDGSDRNPGTSRDKAFQTLKYALSKLQAGDTLHVAGGRYEENDLSINNRDGAENYQAQSGRPGAPVSVIGLPGEDPVICGSQYYPAQSGAGQIAEIELDKPPYQDLVREYPSRILLQKLPSPELVAKYPGSFYLDVRNKKLLVHYAALEQTGVMAVHGRIGMRVCGSFIHIENLTFEGFSEGLYLRPNRPGAKNKAEHITVRDCRFYYNSLTGLCLDGAENTLVTGCRFAHNDRRGGLLIRPASHDNLIIGNWGGDTAMTLRQHKPYEINYAFNQYGFGAGPRNHFIGNVMDCDYSFRWKDDSPDSLFVGNILSGTFCVQGPVKLKKQTMVNNVIAGKINWIGLGRDIWEKDFAGTPILFQNNVRSRQDFKPLYPVVLEAEKLAVKQPEIKFPKPVITDLQVKYIESDSAAISWTTPGADGTGRVAFRRKGDAKFQYVNSSEQGSEHLLCLSGLTPDTEYEFRAVFLNRRGKNVSGKLRSFRTAKTSRPPEVLEVGPGRLSLKEAACMALPGDTIKLTPGRHYGRLSLQKSGLPGKPITILGDGAILDGCGFYAPMLDISNQSHIVVDGICFDNPESTARKGIILADKTDDIVIRNCRGGLSEPHSWKAGGFLSAKSCNDLVLENNIIWGGDYPVTYRGKNVTVRHNTIAKSAMMSLLITDSDNIKIENNIFYRQCVDQKRNQALFFNGKCTRIQSDGNVFFSPIKEHPIGGRFRNSSGKVLRESPTLEDWQKISGQDMHSIHADPMFEDVEKGDFRLKEGSPAAGKGADLPPLAADAGR